MRSVGLLVAVCVVCLGCRTKSGLVSCWGYYEYDNNAIYKEIRGPHYKYDEHSVEGAWEGEWVSIYTNVEQTHSGRIYVRLELGQGGVGSFVEVRSDKFGRCFLEVYKTSWSLTKDGYVEGCYIYNEDHSYYFKLMRCRTYNVLVHNSKGFHGGPPSYAILKQVDPFLDKARRTVFQSGMEQK